MMSNLKPWISFDPEYLNQQVHGGTQNPKRQTNAVIYRWGCGEIHDSNTGLWQWGGLTVRKPGLYHRTDYNSGMELPELLLNTHEKMHASVRARLRLNGSGPNKSPRYKPNSLEGWELGSKGWTYTGQNKDGAGKVLPEDELGYYELQLLDLVDPKAKAELFGL